MKIKKKPDKWDILLIFLAILLAISVGAVVVTCNNDKVEHCKAFCYCQEVGNCSFTFDYDDIKNCDCGE